MGCNSHVRSVGCFGRWVSNGQLCLADSVCEQESGRSGGYASVSTWRLTCTGPASLSYSLVVQAMRVEVEVAETQVLVVLDVLVRLQQSPRCRCH